jgi:hypothetical protein
MKYVALFILILPMLSCEGLSEGSGIVVDKSSKKPVAKATVKNNFGQSTETDSAGVFFSSSSLVGCVPKCPDITVEISKTGFKTISLKNPWRDTIFLEK